MKVIKQNRRHYLFINMYVVSQAYQYIYIANRNGIFAKLRSKCFKAIGLPKQITEQTIASSFWSKNLSIIMSTTVVLLLCYFESSLY